jgi:hypothetical protein
MQRRRIQREPLKCTFYHYCACGNNLHLVGS